MSEELNPDAPVVDAEETEATALAVEMGGNKMVPLSALIAAKREGKVSRDRVKELEPVAARVTEIGGQLETAQPIINAILNNPKLRAAALREANGTRTTADTTEQPDDADLTAFAEDSGWYLADGVTPDAARAQRVLSRLDARHGKQTADQIRPLAGMTLNNKASANIAEAMKAEDDNGTPWATRESILEVAKELPPHLLADPAVVNLVLNSAIGMDRRKNRTPKPAEEPLYMERQGGGGKAREVALTAFERRHLESSGISEKDYRASTAKLGTGRSIELGKG
jgi:hypothetical protein